MMYGTVDILKCEDFEKDDKIIILQMRGRKWASKAGKQNDEVKG